MKRPSSTTVAALSAFVLAACIANVAAVSFVEDWDGASFALTCEAIDLRRFRPHPPGYPLYALLARALGALGLSASACAGSLVRLSAVSLALFASALAALSPGSVPRRALSGALVALCIPGVLRVGTMVGPMALALGSWSCAIALGYRAPHRHVPQALLFACALSSRPSDLVPIAACTVAVSSPRTKPVRALSLACVLALSAHAVLISSVGFQEFLGLVAKHASVHGSIVRSSRSLASHASALGGVALGRTDGVAVFSALVLLSLCVAVVRALPRAAKLRASLGASIAVAWVLFAQPAGVERHWLWCGALCAFALSRARSSSSRRLRALALGWVVCGLIAGAHETRSRHQTPPAAVQLARFVRAQRGALFAGRSGRAAEVEGVEVYEARHVGELRAIAERLPRWPVRLWMTDELHATRDFPDRSWISFCGPRSTRRELVCVRVRMVDLSRDARDFAR